MRLVARYRGTEHVAEVVAGEDGKPHCQLSDGRLFKSPSAAGSAVMGGTACNGWRFWSFADAAATDESPPPREAKASRRPRCERCGKRFASAAQLAHHIANAERLCTPV